MTITKKILDEEGTKILEYDKYNNGTIWLGTDTLYLYKDNIYLHKYNCNLSQYTGKEYQIMHLGDRKSFFSQYQDFWKEDLVEGIEDILTAQEIQSFREQ